MSVTQQRFSYLENYHVSAHETGCKMIGSCSRVQPLWFRERRHGQNPTPCLASTWELPTHSQHSWPTTLTLEASELPAHEPWIAPALPLLASCLLQPFCMIIAHGTRSTTIRAAWICAAIMFVVRCTTTCAGLLSWAMIRVRYCRMLQSVEFCLTQLTLESVILQENRLFASLIKICFACGGQEAVQ